MKPSERIQEILNDPSRSPEWRNSSWGEVEAIKKYLDETHKEEEKEDKICQHGFLACSRCHFNTDQIESKRKIQIVNSPRIDYCGQCKQDHGYECPCDKVVETFRSSVRKMLEGMKKDMERFKEYEVAQKMATAWNETLDLALEKLKEI